MRVAQVGNSGEENIQVPEGEENESDSASSGERKRKSLNPAIMAGGCGARIIRSFLVVEYFGINNQRQ